MTKQDIRKSLKEKLDNNGLHVEKVGEEYKLYDAQGHLVGGGSGGNAVWGDITGTLSNQTDLKNALDGKIAKLPIEPYSQTEYKFPFNINPLVQEADKITTSFDTLVLNDGTTRNHYPMEILSADISNDKAGLMTKAIYDEILSHAGGSDVVEIEVQINTSTFELSGTVTAEQMTKLRATKLARMMLKEGTDVIGEILALTYHEEGHGGAVHLNSTLMPYSSSSRQIQMAYAVVQADHSITGYVRYYGNDLSFTDEPYPEADTVYGMNVNGTNYNFPRGSSGATWGSITGTLADQTDLQGELNNKADTTYVDTALEEKQNISTLDADVTALGYVKSSGVTGITMNGSPIPIEDHVADLGTVITEHQSLSDYATNESLNTGLAGKQNKVTYGTEDPSGGADGDVYIKYVA